MKHFLLIQVICSAIVFSAAGQAEQWDTYMAKFGDKPGSVLVDMGKKDAAPDSRYPYLVITGPQAMGCDKHGMPLTDEIDKMEEMLDVTGTFLNGVTPKVLVGTFTYNCERLNYYYVRDTTGVRNALMRMYGHSYPNYKFAINMKYDKAWATYRTFLYPNSETQDWMENSKTLTEMLNGGDSLTKPRDVIFELYFKTDTGRSAFAGYAKTKGYKADTTQTSKSPNMPYELLLTRYGTVKMGVINEWTTEMKSELRKYNSIYVGWQAPLRKDMKK